MMKEKESILVEVEGGLLRSGCTFPYFMLVAIEGGGFLRGLLLLLFYPLIRFTGRDFGVRLMVLLSFFGLKKSRFRVGRTVLPKFFLEDVALKEFEDLAKASMRVGVSCMPRVMVECFLKDYLGFEAVVGRELKHYCGFYTGFMKGVRMDQEEIVAPLFKEFGKGSKVLGLCSSSKHPKHPLFTHYKEICYAESEGMNRRGLSREKYPKELIFHDGRLAMRPDPGNSLALFMWLPFGIMLSVSRLITAAALYLHCTAPMALTGVKLRVRGGVPSSLGSPGQLYVCNHRTLLDPYLISLALKRRPSCVSYGLSRFSALISPIRISWLTRNLEDDRKRMEAILGRGEDLVVCAEGTTCREPYLLRFSPLFAELTDQVVPVAVDLRVSMFYATTVSGRKWMDALCFLMNPVACYELEFLQEVDTSGVRAGDCSRFDAANAVQRRIGQALGFRCTMLTRKDKYTMLA